MNRRRIGVIKLDWLYMKTFPAIILRQIFKKFFPVVAKNDFCTRRITYKGISEDFRELSEGEILPEYDVIIDENDRVTFMEKEVN